MRAEQVKTIADFFEFAQQWMVGGDTLKCCGENEVGCIHYVLKDITNYIRYSFDEYNGLKGY